MDRCSGIPQSSSGENELRPLMNADTTPVVMVIHKSHRWMLHFADEARELLLSYDWPGNIWELKNLLEAIYIDPPTDWINITHLPTSICRSHQAEQCAALNERELLLSTLCSVDWNKSKAAEQQNWWRMTCIGRWENTIVVTVPKSLFSPLLDVALQISD